LTKDISKTYSASFPLDDETEKSIKHEITIKQKEIEETEKEEQKEITPPISKPPKKSLFDERLFEM